MSDQARSASAVDDHSVRVHPGVKPKFWKSLGNAVRGVRHVFRHERNARTHLWFAVMVAAVGLGLGLGAVQWAVLLLVIMMIFLAEIFNTAIERTLDLIDVRENPQIKLVKDMTAGAVLLASVAAVVVGVAIFGPVLVRILWGS